MQKAGCISILVTKQTRNEFLMYTEYGQGMFRKRLTVVMFNFLVSVEVNFAMLTSLRHKDNEVIYSSIHSQTRHWVTISVQVQVFPVLPLSIETQISSE